VVSDIQHSAAMLVERVPLFEASFGHRVTSVRADILEPIGRDEWDLIEVKSSTGVEGGHLQDAAFQANVIRSASVKLRRCFIAHLNRDYIQRGELDVKKLFVLENVSREIERLVPNINTGLGEFNRFRTTARPPSVAVGSQCETPYHCPLYDFCWRHLPQANVFTLYRGGQKAAKLYRSGVVQIAKIPRDILLTQNQQIQRKTVISKRPYVQVPLIGRFLRKLKYPLALLDFETYNPAIPLFDGLGPYQQVPFQFSCHVVEAPGVEPEWRSHLSKHANDPRREFMKELQKQLPSEGSIVVYNAAFEKGRLRECSTFLPEFKRWYQKIEPRFLDLLDPFRQFNYYHPDQHGSASIKAVLPVLTGRTYDDLVIRNGATAAIRYMQVTFGQSKPEERKAVWADLEKYCGQDTLAMLWIIDALTQLVAPNEQKRRRT
jgi:hypothetical protein